MIAIEIKFLTGKYHATPWGRHVNEGALEWPPSPWRILRALLACWHFKCSDASVDSIRELLHLLSSRPEYRLPTSVAAHTRHYMPAANDVKTKIFDTFICVPPNDPLLIRWPELTLNETQKALLKRLVESLNYFGRAESWVEARLVEKWEGLPDAYPIENETIGDDEEFIRLLGPLVDKEYEDWRTRKVSELQHSKLSSKQAKAIQKGKAPENEKLNAKEVAEISSSIPVDLLEALQLDVDSIRKGGWNRPAASGWIDYACKRSALKSARPSLGAKTLPTIARYAITGVVRPSIRDAVLVGENLRRYLTGLFRKQHDGVDSPVLTGDFGDTSTKNLHSHAHFLAEACDSNANGYITHLTVFSTAGFDEEAQHTLFSLRRMHSNAKHDLQLVLTGMGHAADFGGLDQQNGHSPILATSSLWESLTPFVPTAHLHVRGADKATPEAYLKAIERDLKNVVRKELTRRPWLAEYADHVDIKILPKPSLRSSTTTWFKFRRQLVLGTGFCASSTGYGFQLKFSRPVTGPIAIGYGSHFGLGLFQAIDSE